MKDERLYLSNIKECIERIQEYTRGGSDNFMQTPMIKMQLFAILKLSVKRQKDYLLS